MIITQHPHIYIKSVLQKKFEFFFFSIQPLPLAASVNKNYIPPLQKKRHRAHLSHTTSSARIENTCYSITPWIWCTTASFAHASYKVCGWNKTKPPWPPHRNTIIDVGVLGCGTIRRGEGAAAPFNGVHILGKIWLVGGLIPWPNRDGRT